MTVRANLLVTDRDALAAELAADKIQTHPGAHADTALIVDTRTNLFGLAAFKRGALEAQDEGSQLLAELAHPPSGKGLVIDYCAGAGGKTLAIAARLGNRGRVLASDVDGKKLEELRRRARRATVSNAQAVLLTGADSESWPRELDAVRGKADVVFVDAPCSGIGALRRNPEARWRLRESDIATFVARQTAIMKAAVDLAAPGARVIYATCSLLADENEGVTRQIPGVEPIDLSDVLGSAERAAVFAREGAFTVTPHRHGTDGFYARVFRRR